MASGSKGSELSANLGRCEPKGLIRPGARRPMVNTLSGAQGKCFMKIIVDHASDRVVGMHMIGAASAEIMQVCPDLACAGPCGGCAAGSGA